jgi:AAA+ ATPase superfamily predicted ATPase
MFVGRQNELDFLNQRYRSSAGELLIVYGRRRVGKTETLKEFAKDKSCVFYTCTECTDEQQLRSYSEWFLVGGNPAGRYGSVFLDWKSALESVRELPAKNPGRKHQAEYTKPGQHPL